MTDLEKEIVNELNHPLYTVDFLEMWIGRKDSVFVNAPAALQTMGAEGYYEAVKKITENRAEKRGMSGREAVARLFG